jgi:hypothetical protein
VRSEVLLEETLALVAYDPKRVTATGLERAVAAAAEDPHFPYQARLLTALPAVEVFDDE